jgi:hypothetical protein
MRLWYEESRFKAQGARYKEKQNQIKIHGAGFKRNRVKK